MTGEPLISVSLLGADPLAIGATAHALVEAGADALHCDVMDGHFVPDLAGGPNVIAALRKITTAVLDVHLMVHNPHLQAYIDAGAHSITFHPHTVPDPLRALETLRRQGCQAGLAISPDDDFTTWPSSWWQACDSVLCMSVVPGRGGQPFLLQTCPRLHQLMALWARLCHPHLSDLSYTPEWRQEMSINSRLPDDKGYDLLGKNTHSTRHAPQDTTKKEKSGLMNIATSQGSVGIYGPHATAIKADTGAPGQTHDHEGNITKPENAGYRHQERHLGIHAHIALDDTDQRSSNMVCTKALTHGHADHPSYSCVHPPYTVGGAFCRPTNMASEGTFVPEKSMNKPPKIHVDGGITPDALRLLGNAGVPVHMAVVGSFITRHPRYSYASALQELRCAARQAFV